MTFECLLLSLPSLLLLMLLRPLRELTAIHEVANGRDVVLGDIFVDWAKESALTHTLSYHWRSSQVPMTHDVGFVDTSWETINVRNPDFGIVHAQSVTWETGIES